MEVSKVENSIPIVVLRMQQRRVDKTKILKDPWRYFHNKKKCSSKNNIIYSLVSTSSNNSKYFIISTNTCYSHTALKLK